MINDSFHAPQSTILIIYFLSKKIKCAASETCTYFLQNQAYFIGIQTFISPSLRLSHA